MDNDGEKDCEDHSRAEAADSHGEVQVQQGER